jgi:hypothetical protein
VVGVGGLGGGSGRTRTPEQTSERIEHFRSASSTRCLLYVTVVAIVFWSLLSSSLTHNELVFAACLVGRCRLWSLSLPCRSLATFMNAMTASDWTAYPFSTTNQQDFYNLLGVYLDAAFFPNVRRLDFLQVRWSCEQQGGVRSCSRSVSLPTDGVCIVVCVCVCVCVCVAHTVCIVVVFIFVLCTVMPCVRLPAITCMCRCPTMACGIVA